MGVLLFNVVISALGIEYLFNWLAEEFAEPEGEIETGGIFAVLKRDNCLSGNADPVRKLSLGPIILSTQNL
jgi:hypothetical protein